MGYEVAESVIIKKAEEVYKRYLELDTLIAAPEIMADNRYYLRLVKERADIEGVALKYVKLKKLNEEAKQCEAYIEVSDNAELKKLLTEEAESLEAKKTALKESLTVDMLPYNEKEDCNVVLELRAADGKGAADLTDFLYKTYAGYCDIKRLSLRLDDAAYNEQGKLKYAVCTIGGKNAYQKFKYEGGTHKAIGLSGKGAVDTATAAVFPEVKDADVVINDGDVRVDVFHSNGAGGQNVNKVETAIRITHFPTGTVVTCQDERSQLKNKERAFKILRAKLSALYAAERDEQITAQRKQQVMTGKNDRIRTYNFSSGVATDHRINIEESLEGIKRGELSCFVDALILCNNK